LPGNFGDNLEFVFALSADIPGEHNKTGGNSCAEVFEFKFGISTTRLPLTRGFVEIEGPMGKHSTITRDELKKIDFKNISNPIPNLGYCFNLYFVYERGGRSQRFSGCFVLIPEFGESASVPRDLKA
jgi:hypothetical protein